MIEHVNEDGSVINVYTDEEVAAKDAEIERLKQISVEKTENFRRYNEMTEEQRKAYSENELIFIKQNDQLQDKIKTLEETLVKKEERERQEKKMSVFQRFHGGNDEIKNKIDQEYSLLTGMPETTPEEISARAEKAARLAGIVIDTRNPIYQPINGEAPVYKENKEFTDTPEGKGVS